MIFYRIQYRLLPICLLLPFLFLQTTKISASLSSSNQAGFYGRSDRKRSSSGLCSRSQSTQEETIDHQESYVVATRRRRNQQQESVLPSIKTLCCFCSATSSRCFRYTPNKVSSSSQSSLFSQQPEGDDRLQQQRRRQKKQTSSYQQQLIQKIAATNNLTLEFPYTFPTPSEETTVQLRLVEYTDVEAIASICLNEYCVPRITAFPGANVDLLNEYMEQIQLQNLIETVTYFKVSAESTPNDNVVLVLEHTSGSENEVIGMIEISRQLINPRRCPVPYPIPTVLKQLWGTIQQPFATKSDSATRQQTLQGWITNLLVVPKYRGCGYAKLLVQACEAIALYAWDVESIHLHCDADDGGGRIPQALYLSMGYSPLTAATTLTTPPIVPANNDTSSTLSSSTFSIQGVDLLYLYKEIIE